MKTERLIALCKLWGVVKYFHPYLAYRPIDWDAALVTAIPEVSAAENDEAYAAAVQKMLAALDDPATRVVRQRAGESPLPTSYLTDDSILIVTAANYDAQWSVALERMKGYAEELKGARGVALRPAGSRPFNPAGGA
jgi:hypothetical protein